jgi:hypothetical protein
MDGLRTRRIPNQITMKKQILINKLKWVIFSGEPLLRDAGVTVGTLGR